MIGGVVRVGWDGVGFVLDAGVVGGEFVDGVHVGGVFCVVLLVVSLFTWDGCCVMKWVEGGEETEGNDGINRVIELPRQLVAGFIGILARSMYPSENLSKYAYIEEGLECNLHGANRDASWKASEPNRLPDLGVIPRSFRGNRLVRPECVFT